MKAHLFVQLVDGNAIPIEVDGSTADELIWKLHHAIKEAELRTFGAPNGVRYVTPVVVPVNPIITSP